MNNKYIIWFTYKWIFTSKRGEWVYDCLHEKWIIHVSIFLSFKAWLHFNKDRGDPKQYYKIVYVSDKIHRLFQSDDEITRDIGLELFRKKYDISI